jgi:hypothetical protein
MPDTFPDLLHPATSSRPILWRARGATVAGDAWGIHTPLEASLFCDIHFFSLFLSYRDFADGDANYCSSRSKLFKPSHKVGYILTCL